MTDPLFAASPLAPLRHPAFRALLLMWTLSNLSQWMWSVTAALMLVELHAPPLWIALVQACLTLPVLLFGLPCGALADMVDRRTLLLITQAFAMTLAVATGCLAGFGAPSGMFMLAATFGFGCSIAMRLPAYGATVPTLVPRPHLASALALNAVCMNTSRIIGPLAAGIVISLAGLYSSFMLIAVLCCLSFLLVRSWHPQPAEVQERRPVSFTAAMRGGLAYAFESRPLRSVLLRISAFCFGACALPALLPIVAMNLDGGTPSTFSVLLAAMGSGAVLATSFLQHLRARFSRDTLELSFVVLHALAMLALAFTRSQPLAIVAMLVAGVSWIGAANSMTVHAQLLLPDWVRARGMAIYQMALMGSTAIGAAVWGQVATVVDVHVSLACAAVWAAVGVALAVLRMPHTPPRV